MSVMNILSDTGPVQTPPTPAPAPAPAPAPVLAPAPSSPVKIARNPPASVSAAHPKIKTEQREHIAAKPGPSHERRMKQERGGDPAAADAPTAAPSAYPAPPAIPPAVGPPGLTVRATEEAYAQIVENADLSDIDEPGFEPLRVQWLQRGTKRHAEMEAREGEKRKVRGAQGNLGIAQANRLTATENCSDIQVPRHVRTERRIGPHSVQPGAREGS